MEKSSARQIGKGGAKFRWWRIVHGLVVGVLCSIAGGCIAAAAGAGGAGAGIYLTAQGAESVAPEPANVVAIRARAVLEAEGIQPIDHRQDGSGHEFRGLRGDTEVRVELEGRPGGGTTVSVSARAGVAAWDKEYALRLARRITHESGGYGEPAGHLSSTRGMLSRRTVSELRDRSVTLDPAATALFNAMLDRGARTLDSHGATETQFESAYAGIGELMEMLARYQASHPGTPVTEAELREALAGFCPFYPFC